MGRITMTGTARRSVPYDRMKLSFELSDAEKSPAEAAAKTEAQCEELLGILKDQGFDLSQARIESISTGTIRPELHSGGTSAVFTASRRLSLDLEFEMSTVNFFTSLISEKGWEASMDTSFSVSEILKIRRELLKEALEDSRSKAEMIAGSIGQRITGIEEVRAGEQIPFGNDCAPLCGAGMLRAKSSLSDQLSAAVETVTESITVVWELQ
ncbi:MAG: SIMPL domain-containing protein [Ruminococcus sp.]|nr:SIMPL domain-containing protein [Ruminococcus sp.]